MTLEFKDDINRAIFDMVTYNGPLNKTGLETIRKRKYLSGHVDTCEWNGQKVAYKCIEFSDDVEPIQREMHLRERLGSDFIGIAPILAVVIDPNTQYVDGIILPLYDSDLETFANEPRAQLRLSDLLTMVQAIRHLQLLGITHGDICERNVVVNVSCDYVSRDIALVDFGEVAPGYGGDLESTAGLLVWCANNFRWTTEEDVAINAAAAGIQKGDYVEAFRILASVHEG
jgi:hypothetical protein